MREHGYGASASRGVPSTEWWTWVVGYIPRWFICPPAVTHQSTNRARRMATTLIGHDMLTTRLQQQL